MEYEINIIGEFSDQQIERLFSEQEVKKNLRFVRYLLLFTGIVNFLIGIPDYIYRMDIDNGILMLSFLTRLIILLIALLLFVFMKKAKRINRIRRSIYLFACAIYFVHIYVGFSFAPLPLMFETFNLVFLMTCLFMLPNRWIINLSFSLLFIVVHSLIVVPLLCAAASAGERTIAMIYVFWNLIIVSALFYSINQYKRKHYAKTAQMEELVNTDQLTKLLNRKACDEIFEKTCTRGKTFSVILFDIDNFKNINDTYGHVAGDEVLVTITRYVKTIIRKEDLMARWGGEEFLIILPFADFREASDLAQRVRECVSRIKHARINQEITCSFGVTTYAAGDDVKSMTHRADQLLYLAKEYGKNRVVSG